MAKIQNNDSTSTFTVAPLTIAKRWKQPKCPLTDEWINKMRYVCNETRCSLKKEGNAVTRFNMNKL